MILYGIQNCDTVKNARKWLESHGHEYRFHDLRRDGIDAAMINDWISQIGIDGLLNKKSTSFRSLTDAQKQNLDVANAVTLILQCPTLIKRPLLLKEGTLFNGFSETRYLEIFNQ